jgi:surface antigen
MNRDTGNTNTSNFWFTDWMPSSSSRWGDGINWSTHAASLVIRVDNTPAVGAVAYFTYNHVAYVESVNSDGSVNVSEYNYHLDYNYDTRSNVFPAGYIHIVH